MLDQHAIDEVAQGNERVAAQLRATPTVSMVVGPRGDIVAAPPAEQEGIVMATVDLNEEIVLERAHDIVGTYNRFDIFDLRVDKRRHPAITTIEQDDASSTDRARDDSSRDASPLFDLTTKEATRDIY